MTGVIKITLMFSFSHLQLCPLRVVVSVGGRSFPGGRTGCVSFSPSVLPCSTGYAPETQDTMVTNNETKAQRQRAIVQVQKPDSEDKHVNIMTS